MTLSFLAEHLAELTSGRKRLLVGFSGGSDSTLALLTAQKACHKTGAGLLAVHFNHGLRLNAVKEAEFAAEFAQSRGIAFQRIDLHLSNGPDVENRARESRLAAWQTLASGADCAVVLGHHAGDRMENFLLRLSRGSGLESLTSMRETSCVNNVDFVRPLLNITKCEVLELLAQAGVSAWNEDESNADTRYSRNFFRGEILPRWLTKLPGAELGIRRSIALLEADSLALEELADRAVKESDLTQRRSWQNLPSALRSRIFQRSCRNYGVQFNASAWRKFDELLISGCSGVVQAGEKLQVVIHDETLYFKFEKSLEAEKTWHWREMPQVVWNNFVFSVKNVVYHGEKAALNEAYFAELPEQLIISGLQPGDKIRPFNQDKCVSARKLRIDRRIAPEDAVALRGENREIIFLPFVRHGGFSPAIPGKPAKLIEVSKLCGAVRED